jgi:hypothetical protein
LTSLPFSLDPSFPALNFPPIFEDMKVLPLFLLTFLLSFLSPAWSQDSPKPCVAGLLKQIVELGGADIYGWERVPGKNDLLLAENDVVSLFQKGGITSVMKIELQPQVRGVRVALDESAAEGAVLSAFFEFERADTNQLQLIIFSQMMDATEIVDAQVLWDHDSLYVEAEEPEEGYMPATSENLEHLLAELPRPIAAFKAAVLRGRPADA